MVLVVSRIVIWIQRGVGRGVVVQRGEGADEVHRVARVDEFIIQRVAIGGVGRAGAVDAALGDGVAQRDDIQSRGRLRGAERGEAGEGEQRTRGETPGAGDDCAYHGVIWGGLYGRTDGRDAAG